MQLLKIPRESRVAFRRLLRSLAADGELVQIHGHRFGLPAKMDLVVGRLVMHPDGYGFVAPERTDPEGDVYVASANLIEAMHGDRVVVRVERRRGDRRREGRILRILERRNQVLLGRFESDRSGLGVVVPFERRQVMDVQVPRGEDRGASPGDMVMVEITRWPTATRGPLGRVVEVLGPVDAPGVDTRIIIRKHGIPDEHGPEAVDEARRLGGEVGARDLDGRTDFRATQTVTIDGEHARDFDDAITLERLAGGRFRLGVHIADVSHYVKEGSALDDEARDRGTSVYFPERAVHMFPSELATGLCSLNPGVDRLVQSCLMDVDARGQVVRCEFHDGVIRSDARMTYTDVNAILALRDSATIARYEALVPLFEAMRDLYEILRERRHSRGSIDFDLPESVLVLDEEGMVEEVIASERNVAHRIIEEFMLLANETVAGHLEASGCPALYRVHDTPDPLRVLEFESFVAGLGYSLAAPPGAVRPRHFQKLIERLRGKPEERPVAFLMLRTMALARYDASNTGHFGLAAPTYTHFTSPIRRYPDLIVHRLLREVRHGLPSAARREELAETLPELARHASERERRAVEAERELVRWKKVRFMADKVGEQFSGYITGAGPMGIFVELVEHYVEGLVHVSTMADDYYRYLEVSHSLRGEHTGKEYRLGDRIKVQVVRVDLEQRRIDLGLVEVLDNLHTSRAAPAPKRHRAAAGRARPVRRPKRQTRPGRRRK